MGRGNAEAVVGHRALAQSGEWKAYSGCRRKPAA